MYCLDMTEASSTSRSCSPQKPKHSDPRPLRALPGRPIRAAGPSQRRPEGSEPGGGCGRCFVQRALGFQSFQARYDGSSKLTDRREMKVQLKPKRLCDFSTLAGWISKARLEVGIHRPKRSKQASGTLHGAGLIVFFSPSSLLLGFYLGRKKESWPHSLAAPLNSVAGLCQALSSSCPPWLGSVFRPCAPLVLCGWALCPGLVLLLSSAGRALLLGLVLSLSLS